MLKRLFPTSSFYFSVTIFFSPPSFTGTRRRGGSSPWPSSRGSAPSPRRFLRRGGPFCQPRAAAAFAAAARLCSCASSLPSRLPPLQRLSGAEERPGALRLALAVACSAEEEGASGVVAFPMPRPPPPAPPLSPLRLPPSSSPSPSSRRPPLLLLLLILSKCSNRSPGSPCPSRACPPRRPRPAEPAPPPPPRRRCRPPPPRPAAAPSPRASPGKPQ